MWDNSKFNSGEWNVNLKERINGSVATIEWNWFENPDILLPILQADAIKRQYGRVVLILKANYLPYSRQDRVFQAGQPLALDVVLNILSQHFDQIEVMGLHADINHPGLLNKIIGYKGTIPFVLSDSYNLVFPDQNANKHFDYQNTSPDIFDSNSQVFRDLRAASIIEFTKVRDSNNRPHTELKDAKKLTPDVTKPFLICDDICDGGRTFTNVARTLQDHFGNNGIEVKNDIKIELMVYHAFMTHGLDDLKASGISKVYVLNPDSHKYVLNKFKDDRFFA